MDTGIRRLVKFQRDHQHTSCLNIKYDDLLAQPIDTIRRIYNYYGLAWSEEFETAMVAWLRDNPQGKQGRATSDPFDEDCLYLNIWTPHTLLPSTSTGYPVMLWMHGGGLQEGSSTQIIYDGLSWRNAAILANKSFILVSINYRLNVFGFFAQSALIDDNGQTIANRTFSDQLMAMKWIQDNIGYFGGDKNKVTLAGQSRGSQSVCIHIISPLSVDLFHPAILESGFCDATSYMHDKQATDIHGDRMANE
ncbi:unnamed protein product [Rotaria sordida]|uniref:Carboxylesterase type B domain-containing protein n=2 Tax=Rotaria sordida TaxID=392033 RepID=A0A818X858_9BILA|nr:unnamed protein product [Rotaria sordida]